MKRFVVDLLEKAAEVLCQAPIRLGDENVPHPDIAIVSRSTRPLRPTDALLLIEVANTSLRKDRDQKGAIYARHGIREYWIVDVNGRGIVRFTDLRRKTYHSIVQFDDGTIAPSAYPEIEIDIEELFRSIDDVAG